MPTEATSHVEFGIYVDAGPDNKMMMRRVVADSPLGIVFEIAMKIMRDEGWDRVEIVRTRTLQR
jgi:hypothetical protein